MKAKDMIAVLQQVDPEAEVLVAQHGDLSLVDTAVPAGVYYNDFHDEERHRWSLSEGYGNTSVRPVALLLTEEVAETSSRNAQLYLEAMRRRP